MLSKWANRDWAVRPGVSGGMIAWPVCLMMCCQALGAVELCPPPKHVSWAGSVAVSSLIVVGGEGEEASYARRLVRSAAPEGPSEAGRTVTVVLRLARDAGRVAQAARAAGVPAPPSEAFPESYVIGPSGRGKLTITGGPTGLIYGADTLTQLLRGGRLHLAAISDWPTMRERGYTGCVRDVEPDDLKRLDWFARWRLNAVYYEIYGDRGQDSVPEVVADIARECRRRGIFPYGLISNWRTARLLKRSLCPSNADDLARIRRYAEELMDRGCQGLIFLFDDISQDQVEHAVRCRQCKGRYKTLAGVQLGLLRPMLEVGRKRGAQRFIVCPTPYYERWKSSYHGKLDGCAYFRQWRQAPELADVAVYHCLIRSSRLREVFECGLRNYVYWYNGLRPYFSYAPGWRGPEGTWGGLSDLAYGWYLCRWEGAKGLQPTADANQALRELPKLTRRAWLCGGGWFQWALWGTYLWAADRMDAPDLRRLAIARYYGADAARAYVQWEAAVRPWLARMVSPDFAEAMPRPQAIAQGMKAAAEEASRFAGEFQRAAAASPGAAAMVDALGRDAKAMSDTAKRLAEEARAVAAGEVRVEIGKPETKTLAGGAKCSETRISLQRGLFRYLLRYSQTVEPDGRKHRSRWHFGAGLGMLAPSLRNWYDAGFFDLLLNGRSLDGWTPVIEDVEREGGRCLGLRWDTDVATVTVYMWPRGDGGLEIEGAWEPRGEVEAARVELYAIPGAGWGAWEDMDKAVVTPSGEFRHGKPVVLKPGERWIFLLDHTYDIPHEHAEGPCAVVFLDPLPERIETDNGSYVVKVSAGISVQERKFHMVVYDFHGFRNADALEFFRRKLLPEVVR